MALNIRGPQSIETERLVAYGWTGHANKRKQIGKPPVYSAGDMRFFVQLYIDGCRPFGIDPAGAFLQCIHETGFMTSSRFINSHNPAGIGATDDGKWGGVYPNVTLGIQAQIAHLIGYTEEFPDTFQGQWLKTVDYRFTLIRFHQAKTYDDLAGSTKEHPRWATDPYYGHKIEAHWHSAGGK